MSKKYKFKISQGLPSDAEINRHKDFNSILLQHKKRKQMRRRSPMHLLRNKMSIGTMVIVFAALVAYLGKMESERRIRKDRMESIGLSEPIVTLESLQAQQ